MLQLQWLQDSSGDVRATAYGFREDDLRHVGAQFLGGVDEVGEAAAEAPPGHLPGLDLIGLDEARIHEFIALIVEKRRRLDAAPVKESRRRDE